MDRPVMRRVHRERALLAGGGRALVMQVAHPKVAAGVAGHSDFPAGAAHRLRRTIDLSLALVFGTEEEQRASAGAIRAVHDRVRGPGYDANDPDLLLWVHATLVDSTYVTYGRFVGRMPDAVQERYYEESKHAARVLGVPDAHLPPTLAAFDDYLHETYASGVLRATPEGRRLVGGILRPPVHPLLRPAAEAARLVTLELLPEPVARVFGLRSGRLAWGATKVLGRGSKTLLPVLPARLRAFRAAR